MERLRLPGGTFLSYERYGTGAPLVLVHGSMSDHETGWSMLKGSLSQAFSVYAVDRRGRGETTAPQERSLEEEFGDIAALIEAVGRPTFVLGHSFGAHCAMGGAAMRPELVSKLVLYEPPVPNGIPAGRLAHAEEAAERGDWEGFVRTFLLEGPKIPAPLVEALQTSPFWPPMVADAPATLSDVRTLGQYHFDPAAFSVLTMPVLLLVGSESARASYVTDTLAAVLPDHQTVEFQGQGHVAQAMVPQVFVETVSKFLLS